MMSKWNKHKSNKETMSQRSTNIPRCQFKGPHPWSLPLAHIALEFMLSALFCVLESNNSSGAIFSTLGIRGLM